MRKAKEKQKPADWAREDISSDAAEAMVLIRAEQDAANQYDDEQDDDESYGTEYDDDSVQDTEQEDKTIITASKEEFPMLVSKPAGVSFFKAAPKEETAELGSMFRGLPF